MKVSHCIFTMVNSTAVVFSLLSTMHIFVLHQTINVIIIFFVFVLCLSFSIRLFFIVLSTKSNFEFWYENSNLLLNKIDSVDQVYKITFIFSVTKTKFCIKIVQFWLFSNNSSLIFGNDIYAKNVLDNLQKGSSSSL